MSFTAQSDDQKLLPSPRRALTTGLRYGLYCVGCCWALMGLMFFAGVMNLTWILIIAGYVAIEKLLPETKWLSRTAGILLCAAGLWLVVASGRLNNATRRAGSLGAANDEVPLIFASKSDGRICR